MTSPTPPPAAPTPPPAAPTPQELLAAPELAILVALRQLLDLTAFRLLTIYPELASERSLLHPLCLEAIAADDLIQLGARLSEAMTSYQITTLAAIHDPDTDDIPF
jgi:hypothetical protein